MTNKIENVVKKIEFHDMLNPKLWKGYELALSVRIQLLRTAISFIRFLNLPGLKVKDIILTGSNASYNYTDDSDIDLHLVVDPSQTDCPDLAMGFFDTKRMLWNSEHDIKIHGIRVEIYVESANEEPISNGIYSILKGEWIEKPSCRRPSWDDRAVKKKAEHIAFLIDELISQGGDASQAFSLMKRISAMRRAGLGDGGMYSVENLAYKTLRSTGYLKKLYDYAVRAHDGDLSI